MNFDLSADQRMMCETFARFLSEQSSTERVRAAANTNGFDADLWAGLADMGAFALRIPEDLGGLGLGTMDAAILMEEAGRTLVSGPLAETLVAARALALLAAESEAELLEAVIGGQSVLTLALKDIVTQPVQWVSGAAVATAILARNGDQVVLVKPAAGQIRGEENLASTAMAEVDFNTVAQIAIGSGADAVKVFQQAVEEWKLLMAVALSGLAREAIRLAAAYACEREAFGQPIGAYQAISHPLADLITEVDGGKYLAWKAIHDISKGLPAGGHEISMALWWNADSAGRACTQALHTFGGYGLATEYDVHLFTLRSKGWPLVAGDPGDFLAEAGRRLYAGEAVALPEVGDVPIDFDLGPEAEAMAQELDELFDRILTPELRAKAHYSFDGFDRGVHKALAAAGLVFPAWPKEMGGRNAEPYVMNALRKVWEKYGWTSHPVGTTTMVGMMIAKCGTEELKAEVLPKIISGDAICSLGYSEPSCGSDVFAAKTRAVQQEDGSWLINGSKMWTSGANIAQYVLMLTRTNPDVAKHKGLTMFLVPLDAPGIEVHPVYTFQEERTNITYYDNVRIPDSWRLGEIDGGVRTMAAALELEHGGGFNKELVALVHHAEELCREVNVGNGKRLIDTENAQKRLARTLAHYYICEVLANRCLFSAVQKEPNKAYGPMIKLFSSEKFQSDSRDLLDLTAPYSLSYRKGTAAAHLNLAYRHAHGTTIYGGTSEVHRSQIAERNLGLPRTRG